MPEFGTCQCGCGRRTRIAPKTDRSKGWVKGRPLRFVRGHAMRSAGVEYRVDPVTGCWNWALFRNRGGYGVLSGKLAHRVFYERAYGAIPPGLHIDHLCLNRACVNPAHLEAVSQAENNRRAAAVRRARLEAAA